VGHGSESPVFEGTGEEDVKKRESRVLEEERERTRPRRRRPIDERSR